MIMIGKGGGEEVRPRTATPGRTRGALGIAGLGSGGN